jgi:acyl dehydratase
MPAKVIDSIAALKDLAGQDVGTSDWFVMEPERVQAFADVTEDRQWIHCDMARAARESPYGAPIAHGLLTLSLGPRLMDDIVALPACKLVVNYGYNRVRFPNAVRIGARLRMHLRLLTAEEVEPAVQTTWLQTFEVAGEAKPACVAEMLLRLYF